MATAPVAEDLHYNQGVECNHCGASLAFSAELQAVACNFCGNSLPLESLRRIEVIQPDCVIPFKTTADTFFKTALHWLVSGDYVPMDVLAKANFADNLGVYIPCVFYTGTFSANWSAMIGAERHETIYVWRDNRRQAETKKHIDYTPCNGSAHGEFAFVACASGKLNEAQKRFVEALPGHGAERFDERLTLGFAMENLTSRISKDALFDERVSGRLENTVDQAVARQITGDHVKDIRSSYQYRVNQNGTFLMPVWLLAYDYEGEQHSILMDGRNPDAITGTKPQDQAQKKAVRRPFYVAGAIFALCCFGFMLAGDNALASKFVAGLFPASIVMLLGAFLHRFVLLKHNLAIRHRALDAFHRGDSFDLDGELEVLRGHKFGPRAVFLGSAIAAALALVGTDTYKMLAPDEVAPPAAAIASQDDGAGNSGSSDTTSQQQAADTAASQADEALNQADADVNTAAVEQTPVGEISDVQEQSTTSSGEAQSAPASTPALAAAPAPVIDRQAEAIEDTMTDARRCFSGENYDCAEANAKTVLRLDPTNRDALGMLRQIARMREQAMQSDWNAH